MNDKGEHLPEYVTEYIASVINTMHYRKKVRLEVQKGLIDHFTNALADCETESKKQQTTKDMIADFADTKLLARLIRRSKKRCRPLWKKLMLRTGQVMLAAYIISCLCNAWVIHTWANYGKIDYTERFNQLSRPDTPQAENAAVYYTKAAELFIEPPESIEDIVLSSSASFVDLDQEQKATVEKWFADNEPAWRQVGAAVEVPYCWWETDDLSHDNIENLMPQLGIHRTFARLGLARARHQAAQNQFDQAAVQCYTILRMGKHFSGPKLLVEHLVGMACIARTELYLLAMLDNFEPEKLPLEQMQKQLQTIFADGFPMLNSKVEMNWNLGNIQNLFSQNGMIDIKGYFVPGVFLALGDRGRLDARAQSLHDNLYRYNPYQYQSKGLQKPGRALSGPEFMLDLTRRSLENTRDANYCYKALHEALVTIIALQRWKLEKHTYPEMLQELVTEGSIGQLAGDPYSDGILKYQRKGDNFILYSVGADFDDDGGVENHKDPWGREETGGDRVFWPYVPRAGT